jgi:hypothetical protein
MKAIPRRPWFKKWDDTAVIPPGLDWHGRVIP